MLVVDLPIAALWMMKCTIYVTYVCLQGCDSKVVNECGQEDLMTPSDVALSSEVRKSQKLHNPAH